MSSKKKNQLTTSSEWAKHLRKIGKRFFWKGERLAEKGMIKKEVDVGRRFGGIIRLYGKKKFQWSWNNELYKDEYQFNPLFPTVLML